MQTKTSTLGTSFGRRGKQAILKGHCHIYYVLQIRGFICIHREKGFDISRHGY